MANVEHQEEEIMITLSLKKYSEALADTVPLEKYNEALTNTVPLEKYNEALTNTVPLEKYTEVVAKASALKNEVEQITKDAELSEFLLYTREQIAQFEKNYCVNLPLKDDYIKVVGYKANIFPSQISDDIHFRKWLWILLDSDETRSNEIITLRTALKRDSKRYLWFAKQMEVLYSVLCDDIHGKSPLEIRYMKKANFSHYITFFNKDVRLAIKQFMECLN